MVPDTHVPPLASAYRISDDEDEANMDVELDADELEDDEEGDDEEEDLDYGDEESEEELEGDEDAGESGGDT